YDVKGLLASLRRSVRSDDVVLVLGAHSAEVFHYYHQRDPLPNEVKYLVVPGPGQEVNDMGDFRELARSVFVEGRRLWVVELRPEAVESYSELEGLATRRDCMSTFRDHATLWERGD